MVQQHKKKPFSKLSLQTHKIEYIFHEEVPFMPDQMSGNWLEHATIDKISFHLIALCKHEFKVMTYFNVWEYKC